MLTKAVVKKTSNVLSTPCDIGVPVAALNSGNVVKIVDTELGWSLIEWSPEHTDPIVGWMRNENLEVCMIGDTANWTAVFATSAIVALLLVFIVLK